jgi:hypothetical protein
LFVSLVQNSCQGLDAFSNLPLGFASNYQRRLIGLASIILQLENAG